MKIEIEATPKEIAELVVAIQERQEGIVIDGEKLKGAINRSINRPPRQYQAIKVNQQPNA